MCLTAVPERRWRAPALSSLVNRLNQPSTQLQPNSNATKLPSTAAKRADQQKQFYLDGSSDEDEEAVAEALPAAADRQQGALSIYTMAAAPFQALIACVAKPPGLSTQVFATCNCEVAEVCLSAHMLLQHSIR